MKRQVFIYVRWRNQEIIIPENIDNLTKEHFAPPHTHNIIGIGARYAPSYTPPITIILENAVFNKQFIDRYLEDGWTPRQYADWLKQVRDSREPVELVIESDYLNYETHIDALIDFAEWNIESQWPDDIAYSLMFYEYIHTEIEALIPTTDSQGNIAYESSSPSSLYPSPPAPAAYTVVAGDSLTAIARRHGQPDNAWRELYETNRELIHQRGNRDLIFPGQILNLPESWQN